MEEKDRTYSPWTDNELYKIKLVQGDYGRNPHLCPTHRHEKRALIATKTLLFCVMCGYTQKWVSKKIIDRGKRG